MGLEKDWPPWSPDRRFRLRKTTTSGCRIDCYCLNGQIRTRIELRESLGWIKVSRLPHAQQGVTSEWFGTRGGRTRHTAGVRLKKRATKAQLAASSWGSHNRSPRPSWIATVRYFAARALDILPLSAWANGLSGRSTRRAAGARLRAKQRAASMGARRRLRNRSRTTKSYSVSDAVSGSGESAGAWTRRPPAGRAALIWRGASRPGLRQWTRPRRSTRTLRNCLQTFVQPLTKW